MIIRMPFGSRGRTLYSKELGHTIKEVRALDGNPRPANDVFISIREGDIPILAAMYFHALETEETDDWCKCLWRIHPEDQGLSKNTCRECGVIKTDRIHVSVMPGVMMHIPDGAHPFKGIRKIRIDDNPGCPVHTKEGMLTYFFEWVLKR